MTEYIGPERVAELLKIKQSRNKKVTPVSRLPQYIRTGLQVRYNSHNKKWEVREAVEILYTGSTEIECRQERDRLENERA